MASSKRSGEGDDGGEVIDIREAMLSQQTRKLRELIGASVARIDDVLASLLPIYREWEESSPGEAVPRHAKLEMLRHGFVGAVGFERCHETHRRPSLALFGEAARQEDILYFTETAELAEEIMCPAMETGRCLPIWRGFSLPPCKLLLLEVYMGMGGGVLDEGVQQVVDELLHPEDPARWQKEHITAERLVRHWEKREVRAEKEAAARHRRESEAKNAQAGKSSEIRKSKKTSKNGKSGKISETRKGKRAVTKKGKRKPPVG